MMVHTVTRLKSSGSDKFVYIEKNLKSLLFCLCISLVCIPKEVYVRKIKSSNLSGLMNILDSTPAQMGVRSADTQRMIPFRFWINTHILQISYLILNAFKTLTKSTAEIALNSIYLISCPSFAHVQALYLDLLDFLCLNTYL